MSLSDFAKMLKGIENGLNSIAKAKSESPIEGSKPWPCYRNVCSGIMHFDPSTGMFVCDSCGAKAWLDELKENDLGLIDLNVGDTYNGVKGYSFAYDPDGNHFRCPECGGNVLDDEIHQRQVCSICGHVITAEEYEDMLREWDIATGGDGDI